MKKIFALLALVVFLVGLAGCQGKQEPGAANDSIQAGQVAQGQTEGQILSRLNNLKRAFKDAGFVVGENEILAYDMLHADAGMKFTLDEELVEVYEYDMSNLSDDASAMVEQAQGGSINFSGFNVPVKFKDGLMLVRYDEHSQGEKITKIFNEF